MFNIRELFEYCKTNEVPLLSSYSATFWLGYIANYQHYDGAFDKEYKSFIYYDQKDDDNISDVVSSFSSSVYNWLLLNHKKYEELYRIDGISDSDYQILENYKMAITTNKTINFSKSDMFGQRTDISYDNIGSQNISEQNRVTGFNSNSENNSDSTIQQMGTRQDAHQFTKGSQNDTGRSLTSDSGSDIRHGIIGNITQSDIIEKHIGLWEHYNFYTIVFKDICNHLLLVE